NAQATGAQSGDQARTGAPGQGIASQATSRPGKPVAAKSVRPSSPPKQQLVHHMTSPSPTASAPGTGRNSPLAPVPKTRTPRPSSPPQQQLVHHMPSPSPTASAPGTGRNSTLAPFSKTRTPCSPGMAA